MPPNLAPINRLEVEMNRKNFVKISRLQALTLICSGVTLFLFISLTVQYQKLFVKIIERPLFIIKDHPSNPPKGSGLISLNQESLNKIINSSFFLYRNQEKNLWVFSIEGDELPLNLKELITNELLEKAENLKNIKISSNNESMIYQYQYHLLFLDSESTDIKSLINKVEYDHSFDDLCFAKKCHPSFLAITLHKEAIGRI